MPTNPDETMDRRMPGTALPGVRVETRLRQIADVLGCSIDDFFDGGPTPPALEGASELLELWSGIADEQARAKLLARVKEALFTS